MMRFGGDGETKSVTTLKGDMVKTYIENEMTRTTTLRDNSKKITTTLTEAMGKKFGFYTTDEDQAVIAKRMDSMMQSRAQGGIMDMRSNAVTGSTFSYLDENKKVAGITCKKALLISTRKNGTSDTTVVWYAPDFKLQGIVSTGGTSALAVLAGLQGLMVWITLPVFLCNTKMKMGRGRKMIVEVTKINTDKEVADKEFEIPKDFEVKSMKEMQAGGNNGRGFQIRMGGPGGN